MQSVTFRQFQDSIRRRNDQLLSTLRGATDPYEVGFEGLTLTVLPQVFSPTLGEGSRLLAKALRGKELSGKTIIDLGTGSGALALKAAEAGARRVVASDISHHAVECARANADALGLSERIHVRQGDLFEVLDPGERFDVILFNPPFLEGHAHDLLERAVFDEQYQVQRRFFAEVSGRLAPGGVVLIAFGDVGSVQYLRLLTDGSGLSAREVLTERLGHLRFFVLELA